MPLKYSEIVKKLSSTVPFVGPEALERKLARNFNARIGANESVFGPSPLAVKAMKNSIFSTWMYGDPENYDLKTALAKKHCLKPENIFIRLKENKDGEVLFDDPVEYLVADFGTSKIKTDAPRNNNTTTVTWRSEPWGPERTEKEKKHQETWDGFSWAAVCISIVGNTYFETDEELRNTLKSIKKDIPNDVFKLLEACLSKQPGKRPKNISEVRKIFKKCV